MTLFEAGILAKMTTDEYKNLPEHARRSEPVAESDTKENSDPSENTGTAQVQNLYHFNENIYELISVHTSLVSNFQ